MRSNSCGMFRVASLVAGCLLLLGGASELAAAQQTQFVHAVGFSFDYPSKWRLERVQEGVMLVPHDVSNDASGRPKELLVIGFLDTEGVTDPFDPRFGTAFEHHYRGMIPGLERSGDMDWLESGMGTGLAVPFLGPHGNRHRVYCMVHGDLGIFLAHVTLPKPVRPRAKTIQAILSSFGWSESAIDPTLVRAWTSAASDVADGTGSSAAGPTTASASGDSALEDRALEDGNSAIEDKVSWTFTPEGRLRFSPTQDAQRDGFYSSFDGVLNIVWDHGVEEHYLYSLSEGGTQLELKQPDGPAFRLR